MTTIKYWILLTIVAIIFPTRALAVHIKAGDLDLTTLKVANLEGEVNATALERFMRETASTGFLFGDRVILINSPGGYAAPGEGILSIMRKEREAGTHLICVVTGEADSMAFNILTHCDIRLAVKGSTFLVHKIRRGPGCGSDCTAKQLREVADDLDKSDEPYRQANSKAMKLSLEEYDAKADAETTWSTATLIERGYLKGTATVEK